LWIRYLGQPKNWDQFSFRFILEKFTTSYQIKTGNKTGSDGGVAESLVQLFHDLFPDAATQEALTIWIDRREATL